MQTIIRPLCLSLLLLSSSAPAWAQEQFAGLSREEQRYVVTDSFMRSHPDLKHRGLGMEEYERGSMSDAMMHFQEAAHLADKASQAMIAHMRWQGEGGVQDRALAYAWMDLAAERGYPVMLAKREQYWAALNPAERADAVARGVALYDTYGDAAAKPRLETQLQRARARITGSRTGYVGFLEVEIPSATHWERFSGEVVYAKKFMRPEQYWAWQDQALGASPDGKVVVGPLDAGEKSPNG